MPERHEDNSAKRGKVQDQIEENLRKLYDETLNEQLPDALLQLLKKLEEGDKRQ